MQPQELESQAGVTELVTMPDLNVARRVMWSDSPGGPWLPVHGLEHVQLLFSDALPQSGVYLVIEGEPPGTPYVQTVRDDGRFVVEVKETHADWPMVMSWGAQSGTVFLDAPWNIANKIPVRERHITAKTPAAIAASQLRLQQRSRPG